MKQRLTIYIKPTCKTCRNVVRVLQEGGVDFESVNYYTESIPKSKLKALLRKMGMRAGEIIRTKEKIYTDLKLAERNLTDDELINLMKKYPDLIQRPIVEKGEKAILARPPERIRAIL